MGVHHAKRKIHHSIINRMIKTSYLNDQGLNVDKFYIANYTNFHLPYLSINVRFLVLKEALLRNNLHIQIITGGNVSGKRVIENFW